MCTAVFYLIMMGMNDNSNEAYKKYDFAAFEEEGSTVTKSFKCNITVFMALFLTVPLGTLVIIIMLTNEYVKEKTFLVRLR